MNFARLLLRRFHSIGWLGRCVLITCFASAVNFGIIFVQNWRAASASGTQVIDGFELTICYFGPPVGFYPRFFVLVALLVASIGVFRRTFPRSIIATLGVAGGFLTYVYWWLHSYRVFRNFTEVDIPIIDNPEITQVAYLYQGTRLDLCVVAALIVCLVLLFDRLLNRPPVVS
jgi:uncharacterized membrane protein